MHSIHKRASAAPIQGHSRPIQAVHAFLALTMALALLALPVLTALDRAAAQPSSEQLMSRKPGVISGNSSQQTLGKQIAGTLGGVVVNDRTNQQAGDKQIAGGLLGGVTM